MKATPTSSFVTETTKTTSVATIIRDNNNFTANREIINDKAAIIATLNNSLANHMANSNNNSNNNNNNFNLHHHTHGNIPAAPTTAPNSHFSTANANGTGNNHFYQNIQQFKQVQNELKKTVGNGISANSNAAAATNATPVNSACNTSNANNTNNSSANSNGSELSSAANNQPSQAPKNVSSSSKVRTLDGYVGFANLPNQVYRKSVKKGFEFNMMVIGESGLGKSTFINSLFLTELYNASEFPGTFARKKKTTFVDSTSVVLSEKGVNLRLTVIDTPGFGESIDNTNCWLPIVDYIDNKYEEYLNAESKVNRKLPINDQRVHCCLHFIAPGHTLKQLDIEVMKKIHDRVNLIPVIAKADTMTAEEIKQFKATVLQVIADQKIQIYEFPDIDDDDAENNRTNSILKSKLPFAIVGSNTIIEADGKKFRGRQYPWGCVNVDELAHCDFMALRTMLIRTHMQDFKDVTNNVHYENYRFKKLAYVTGDKNKPTNKNPFQQLEDERKENELRLEKMRNEMEGVFDSKVREKIARLKESELNLEKQQEAMKISLEREEKELEEKKAAFLRDKHMWEESNREEEDKLRQTLDKEADKKKKKMF